MFRRLFLLTLLSVTLISCGHAEPEIVEVVVTAPSDVSYEERIVEVTAEVANADFDFADSAGSGATFGNLDESGNAAPSAAPIQRLIIKNAQLTLQVDDTDATVTAATDLLVGFNGYIVNQNVYSNGDSRYASMRFGVPSADFERALNGLKNLGTVISNSASGDDVTEEYVDLNARLDNLQATQVRLREFLEQAETVEEALDVNRELTNIEEQINVLQGRINYLADRAAFSTIELEIRPIGPAPEPSVWRPARTASTAFVSLIDTTTEFIDFMITFTIAVLPWLLLFGVPALLIVRRVRRQRPVSAPAPPVAPSDAG